MKSIIHNLHWEIKNHMQSMQVAKMTLKDRIAYEKALVKLEVLKALLDKSTVNFAG